jgi:type I restriction enzyme S subunit
MKTYSEYKDSGIEWLGDIPKHWEVKTVKSGFNRIKVKANILDPVILSLTSNGIKIRDISNNEGQIAESYLEYNIVTRGDLLLNPMDLVTNAFSAVSQINGVISPAYINLRTKNCCFANYFDYYFKLQYWNLTFFAFGKGVSTENRWTLNHQTLMNYFIPYPPLAEQQQIANYLDQQTAKIDDLIHKQNQLIKLLQEKKKSLINHVVTKGLNPNIPMKESGIEWLGDIPKHWGVKKIMFIFFTNPDVLSENTDPTYEINYVDISSVTYECGINNKQLVSFANAPSRARKIVNHGDIIISTVRTYLRAIAQVITPEKNLIVSTGFAVFSPKKKFILSDFAAYICASEYLVNVVMANSDGISYPSINIEKLKQIRIPLPPLTEQQQIADYLEQQTAKMDQLINKAKAMVALFKEHKQSLINHVVTGKIKVTNDYINIKTQL